MGDVRKDRRTSQERKRKIYMCKELFLPHMLYIKYLSIMDKSLKGIAHNIECEM